MTLPYTKMAIFPTLLYRYTASLKKPPLSGGGSPYGPLKGVPPWGNTPYTEKHANCEAFPFFNKIVGNELMDEYDYPEPVCDKLCA